MEKLRILLVDDHILFRKGVAGQLAACHDVKVVGEAGDGNEAAALAREVVPDVILMDISMPNCNGLEATKAIKREMPHVRIIMLTVSDDDRDVFTAIKNGADGYLLKNIKPRELLEMLQVLQRGESPISSALAAKILNEFRQPDKSADGMVEGRDPLTPREFEVLELVVQGLTNKEIAVALSVADETVKIHLHNILEKLHMQNRIQAAVFVVRQGLIPKSA